MKQIKVDRTPAPEPPRPPITDLTQNPCKRHGDLSPHRAKYSAQVASVREPQGTCNYCWDYYEAIQAKTIKAAEVRNLATGKKKPKDSQ